MAAVDAAFNSPAKSSSGRKPKGKVKVVGSGGSPSGGTGTGTPMRVRGLDFISIPGPFCGKKQALLQVDIKRLFMQDHTYPSTVQDVPVTVNGRTLHVSVTEIAAVGSRFQKLKERVTSPGSATSDGQAPNGTTSIWLYLKVLDPLGRDWSHPCLKLYQSGALGYMGSLPIGTQDISIEDTAEFHEQIINTVLDKYLDPELRGPKATYMQQKMKWDNFTMQIHYNGRFSSGPVSYTHLTLPTTPYV